jgi:acyl-CoA reductase-like NAD-dependent aldehyde dehydrogenase
MQSAGRTGPRGVSLELGGKSAMIVCADADVEAVVRCLKINAQTFSDVRAG